MTWSGAVSVGITVHIHRQTIQTGQFEDVAYNTVHKTFLPVFIGGEYLKIVQGYAKRIRPIDFGVVLISAKRTHIGIKMKLEINDKFVYLMWTLAILTCMLFIVRATSFST